MNMLPNLHLIADSLGWAVLHSLWQGIVAAGIVFTVRGLTHERASEARYFTGIITLCALLCAFIATFIYYYSSGAAAMSIGLGREETINLVLPNAIDAASTNPLTRLGDFTNLIGIFWAACFTILGMRYLSAFRLTHKLRTQGISDFTEECQARFRTLVEASGVNPKVRAYFSDHVSSPITFGFLKPIVLVPTWFFTGMTPEQCEAVLLHELAHIRRHDYLTNILQIAIKTVFFYHPAVQFICKGLDTDREHACDDFAVMLTKNPEGLATALGTIRLKAARDGGVFALSADGRDAPLMHRLKRLMGTQSKSLEKGTSRGLAATAMIGTALALVMTLGATVSQAHPHKESKKENQIEVQDWDKLAGAATTDLDAWGNSVDETVSVKGKTYTATAFDFSSGNDGVDIINGKKYPSKYAYSVYAKDGESFVVKQKNGKRYMEIGDNWFRVDADRWANSAVMPSTPPATPRTRATDNTDYMYDIIKVDGKKYKIKTNLDTNTTYIKIDNKWYDIDETDLDVVLALNVVAPKPPVSPAVDYTYGYVTKDGETFKVKTKNKTGKSYIKVNSNWDPITVFKTNKNHGHNHIKINGKTYNLNKMPPTPPTLSSTNYWVSDQVLSATEARAEAAEDRREAALERAEEMREREMERAEDLREAAWERAEDQREAVAERVEAALEQAEEQREAAAERAAEQLEASIEQNEDLFRGEAIRAEERRIRDYERKIAKIERKIAHKERDIAREDAGRDRDIGRLERDVAKKQAEIERKLQNNPNMSPSALGQMHGEIGRLQGEIGNIQGMNGRAQGEIGRLQGELGRMQGEIGRIQGEWGRREATMEQSKYYKMRDELIPLLKADGYMKTDISKVTIKMTAADIYVNGKKLTSAKEGEYCDIISNYVSRKGDAKKIVIKPGYLHVSQKGDGYNSTFTHNNNH